VSKAWDSRLAHRVALLLRDTRVHPNHVTTVAMLAGLAGAALYAGGTAWARNWGAVLYLLSAILDHVDGELARLANKCSLRGQTYDRVADLVVRLALFVGMGLGLRHGPLGGAAVAFGLAAGVAFVSIFVLRGAIARRRGWDAIAQPAVAGFELEDVLYVIAPVTWLGWLAPFVVAAGIGAPIFAAWMARAYRIARTLPTPVRSVPGGASPSPSTMRQPAGGSAIAPRTAVGVPPRAGNAARVL
jgi:phosphatidylglycerophosphate synthase